MGSKAPQIFPFHVPLMWILGEVWGSGRGTGSTCSFLSTALRPLLFCFSTTLFTGQHQAWSYKNKNDSGKKKKSSAISSVQMQRLLQTRYWGTMGTAASLKCKHLRGMPRPQRKRSVWRPTDVLREELSEDAHVTALWNPISTFAWRAVNRFPQRFLRRASVLSR